MELTIPLAKRIAFGSESEASLEEYYEAWQFLYDHNVPLGESDSHYLEKLICDGHIATP